MALLGRIKGRLSDGLAPLEARFDAVLAGMKPRDRMLLISVIGVFLLLVAAGIGLGMRSSLDGVRKDLEKEKTRLAQVETMATQYASDAARIGELEEALNEHKGKDLSAFLEQAASKAKAADALTAVTPTSSTTVGSLEQKNFTATLKSVTLEQALDFLYQTEATGYPLKIESATVKVGRGASKPLTLNLEIATFELVDGEAG